jgi:hypothetical protein
MELSVYIKKKTNKNNKKMLTKVIERDLARP